MSVGSHFLAGKIIHVVFDNYGTHKHPNVVQWLADMTAVGSIS